MKKAKVFINAKINLTLDVQKKAGDYHQIESLVLPISIGDYIKVSKRADNKIVIKERGIKCGIKNEDNNAYKTAKAFIEKHETSGVNILINKKIPLSSGLGGSSADIAGTLYSLNKIFGKEELDILDKLGSDTRFMYYNRPAIISGRGEKLEFLKSVSSFFVIILLHEQGVSAKEGYKAFDDLNKTSQNNTKKALEFLETDREKAYKYFSNDLEEGVKALIPKIQTNINALKNVGAKASLMAGSGSAVLGIFNDKKARDLAYKKLKKDYKDKIIKTQTI